MLGTIFVTLMEINHKLTFLPDRLGYLCLRLCLIPSRCPINILLMSGYILYYMWSQIKKFLKVVAFNQTTVYDYINVFPIFCSLILSMFQCQVQQNRPTGTHALKVGVVDSGLMKGNQIYHGNEDFLTIFTIKLWHLRSCEVLPACHLPGIQERHDAPFLLPSWFTAPESQLCAFLLNSMFSDQHFGSLKFDMLGEFTPQKWAQATANVLPLELVIKYLLTAHHCLFSIPILIFLLIALSLACCQSIVKAERLGSQTSGLEYRVCCVIIAL